MSEYTANINYEAQVESMYKEQQKLLNELDEARFQIAEQSRTIAFLEGQVNAFHFCVSKGGEEE